MSAAAHLRAAVPKAVDPAPVLAAGILVLLATLLVLAAGPDAAETPR